MGRLSKVEIDRRVWETLVKFFAFSASLDKLPRKTRSDLFDMLDARGIVLGDIPSAFQEWFEEECA